MQHNSAKRDRLQASLPKMIGDVMQPARGALPRPLAHFRRCHATCADSVVLPYQCREALTASEHMEATNQPASQRRDRCPAEMLIKLA
ncbi:hypothetical protein XAP6164_210003 [Xanthomonas phaseoli pv. phaseoli]|nr:hypothetical protein XAP6164_210003 [Xanthomonas phaseoli pv. phaseoli]